jgi:hypothetical protein
MPELEQTKLAEQIERTNKLLSKLESNRYLQMIDRPWKFLWMSFLQGIAIAAGSTLGLAIILYTIGIILSRLEVFTPISNQITDIKNALENLPSK